MNLDRVLLMIASLICRATNAAWRTLAARGVEFGDLRARIRVLQAEVARRDELIGLLQGRLARMDAASRPRYSPDGRFAILWHVRRWGVSISKAARLFVLDETTVRRWFGAVERGRSALVRLREPLNRLSDLTRELARRLILEQANWGTRRICQAMVRLGVVLSRRSVQRIKREGPPRRPRPQPDRTSLGRPVKADRPNHVWLADLTTVSLFGLRTIWIGAVVDVFSRKVLAIRAWARTPTGRDVRLLLRAAIQLCGSARYLVTDRGGQFKADVLSKFLARRGILRRYGAVARWQSVAVVDRFFGSLKREYVSRWMVLLPLERLNAAIHRYTDWFGRHRPHQGLGGCTPDEVYFRRRRRNCEGRMTDVRRTYFRGDPKLPVYRRVLAA
jgi:transposase InsO family protein